MALLWLDGFDNYGTTGLSPSGVLARKYTNPATNYAGITTGRFGTGYALVWGYDATVYLTTPVLTTNDTMILGIAIRLPKLWNSEQFIGLYDGTTLGVNLRVTGDGELAVYRGGTLLGTTNGANLYVAHWHYIELKVKCNSSTGTYEVKVGGVTVGSGSSLNTKAGANNYHDRVRIIGNSLDQTYYDDWYICDASGALNNDFLGNLKVVTMRPDSAGDSTEFSPSMGDNYTCVDDGAICNDDTDYVDDSTTDHKDLYNYSASTLNTVKGIMACTDCRQTDATAYTLKTPCKSGSTESDDSAQAIGTTSFVTRMRLLETDPNTSSAWALADLNAAQFGVKVG